MTDAGRSARSSSAPTVLDVGRLVVIADDLSGAAETVAALVAQTATECVLGLDGSVLRADGHLRAVDTDSRHLSGPAAAERIRAVLLGLDETSLVIKKIDSLLRGPIAAEVAAIRAAGWHPVVCAALPALGRTVRAGVVHVDGVALHLGSAWRVEHSAPPRSIPELFAEHVPADVLTLSQLRSPELAVRLRAMLASGTTPICDAETREDVRLVAHSVVALSDEFRIAAVGASELARAIGSELAGPGRSTRDELPMPTSDRPVVIVIGSLASVIDDQLDRLGRYGVPVVALAPDALKDPDMRSELIARLRRSARGGAVAVRAGRTGMWEAGNLAALAALVADSFGAIGALVLAGGETARRVLEAMGVTRLRVRGEIAPGAVVSIAPGGITVVTRPGSFGGPDSLVEIVSRLRREGPAI